MNIHIPKFVFWIVGIIGLLFLINLLFKNRPGEPNLFMVLVILYWKPIAIAIGALSLYGLYSIFK
jgi:hypothetical protein